ncbi:MULTISPECIES: hypothetical protein [Neobacillus]|uniref:Uncharacterized protein n=1 Tax=Neobacillus rhizophilus TaxID=2833579 RepID=A0A942YT21_9BACI|nr:MULTISPECIES: hypothetical protein [Neobacillus]MBS4211739.1 hypothetical protein [Neobacillus rhizophilus]MBU8919489.1 hypothetical protein [Bacillus sp. FJAT-29953]
MAMEVFRKRILTFLYTFLLGLFQTQRVKRKKEKGDHYQWRLCVDVPYFFTSKFSIDNNTVTVTGTQCTYDHSWPIRYSIIKVSHFGLRTEYVDSIVINGDQCEKEFKHTFENIPNGEDYQLEVCNYFRYYSEGDIRLLK